MRYKILAGKATIESVEVFLQDIDAIARSSNAAIQAVDASKVAMHLSKRARWYFRLSGEQCANSVR